MQKIKLDYRCYNEPPTIASLLAKKGQLQLVANTRYTKRDSQAARTVLQRLLATSEVSSIKEVPASCNEV